MVEFPIPTRDSEPHDISSSFTDYAYFSEYRGNKIGRITLDGKVTEFEIPTPFSHPEGVLADDNGGAWFTEYSGNKIGHISWNGSIREIPIPTPRSEPTMIRGGDRGIWFVEAGSGKIGSIEKRTGRLYEVELPQAPCAIAVTDHELETTENVVKVVDSLWFTSQKADIVGVFLNRNFRERALQKDIEPCAIAEGPETTIWFGASNPARVGSVRFGSEADIGPTTEVTYFDLHNHMSVSRIAFDQANLWFIDPLGNTVGELTVSVPVAW